MALTRRSLLSVGGALAASVAPFTRGAQAQTMQRATQQSVVLLGDSVFDNKAYVAGGPDVIAQLRGVLPADWRATLGAVDGAVIADVPRQLRGLREPPTHIVVSAGGNDALRASSVLQERASSVGEALLKVGAVARQFRAQYAAMLDALAPANATLAVCTIYDPRFPTPQERTAAGTALAALNDAITREAFTRGIALIDLRTICSDDADFANAIEPSVAGGRKIAAAITAFVASPARGSRVIAGG